VNVVSSTLLSPMYRRVVVAAPTGLTAKRPPRSASTIAPNTDGLSNRGRQSQSIEPLVETSAADRQSPMIA
jgi:hypothetical protein